MNAKERTELFLIPVRSTSFFFPCFFSDDCSEFSGFVSSRSGGGGKNCIRMLVVDVVAKLFIILLNLSLFPGFLL